MLSCDQWPLLHISAHPWKVISTWELTKCSYSDNNIIVWLWKACQS
jgi:hypothetical protein